MLHNHQNVKFKTFKMQNADQRPGRGKASQASGCLKLFNRNTYLVPKASLTTNVSTFNFMFKNIACYVFKHSSRTDTRAYKASQGVGLQKVNPMDSNLKSGTDLRTCSLKRHFTCFDLPRPTSVLFTFLSSFPSQLFTPLSR